MGTALTQILTKKSYQAKRATKSILAYLFEFTPMMFTAMTLALVLFLALEGKGVIEWDKAQAENVMLCRKELPNTHLLLSVTLLALLWLTRCFTLTVWRTITATLNNKQRMLKKQPSSISLWTSSNLHLNHIAQ